MSRVGIQVGYNVVKVIDIPVLNRRRKWEALAVPNNRTENSELGSRGTTRANRKRHV